MTLRSSGQFRLHGMCTLAAAGALLVGTTAVAQQELVDEEQLAIIQQPAAGPAVPSLFEPAPTAMASASSATRAALDTLRADPALRDVTVVRINAQALRGDALRIAPPAAADMVARHTLTEDAQGTDAFTWFGELENMPGSAVLAVRDGNVTGTVLQGDAIYKISPLGYDQLHTIARVDQASMPPDHPADYEELERQAPAVAPQGFAPGQDGGDAFDDGQVRVLKVAVPYTGSADGAVADMDGLIQLAVAETNLSYRNSGIDLRLELVDSYRVAYNESGSFKTDVDRLAAVGDNHLDEVHDRRRQMSADVVLLVINNASACGRAKAIMANEATAFAVVHHSCATGYYSTAHEIGHLQGARHNPEADPTNTPFAFGHGYFNAAKHWRTVMSYNCTGGCTRLPYWSSPQVTYNGDVMGTVATNNNARVLNRTAAIVTAFESEALEGAKGFVWAHNQIAASYTPSATYAHNSSGGDVQVSRQAVGRYAVRFKGLGGNGSAGGHVQVSAYGSTANTCKVASWSSSGADFIANVRCYAANGNAVNTRYNVLVTWP